MPYCSGWNIFSAARAPKPPKQRPLNIGSVLLLLFQFRFLMATNFADAAPSSPSTRSPQIPENKAEVVFRLSTNPREPVAMDIIWSLHSNFSPTGPSQSSSRLNYDIGKFREIKHFWQFSVACALVDLNGHICPEVLIGHRPLPPARPCQTGTGPSQQRLTFWLPSACCQLLVQPRRRRQH